MSDSQSSGAPREDLPAETGGSFRNRWKWLLLGLAGLLVLVLVGLCVWIILPTRKVPVTELLPSHSFAYLSVPLDRQNPAVREMVSKLQSRLASRGFMRKTLARLLLPAAIPASLVVVGTQDETGEAQVLAYASMGRLSKVVRLFGDRVSRAILKGGPLSKERIDGQLVRYRKVRKGQMGFSAMAVVGNVLVLGSSREAVRDCCASYRGRDGQSALRDLLVKAQATDSIGLYVDNSGGGLSRLVRDVSERFAFAAFPSIDAVSSITGSVQMDPESLDGEVAFSSSSQAQIDAIRSDVKFIYGAVRRMARAGGVNMQGDVAAEGEAVVLSFKVPGYLGALAAPSSSK